jgi:hypothetical protein
MTNEIVESDANQLVLTQLKTRIPELTKKSLIALQPLAEIGFTSPQLEAIVREIRAPSEQSRPTAAKVKYAVQAITKAYSEDELRSTSLNPYSMAALINDIREVERLRLEDPVLETSISYSVGFELIRAVGTYEESRQLLEYANEHVTTEHTAVGRSIQAIYLVQNALQAAEERKVTPMGALLFMMNSDEIRDFYDPSL